MAHNSRDEMGPVLSEMFEKDAIELRELIERDAKGLGLGNTGKFPQGRIDPDDEGEIRFGIAAAGGKVVVNFGKPVAWFGMDAEQARKLAESLLEKANDCDGIPAHVRRVFSE